MMREFEIERQFNIKIESIKPNKGVYFVNSDKGAKCLKKINYGIQKLLFVYGAKEHLIKNSFPYVDRYELNIDGFPYALVNEDIYTLSKWINGRECNFHDKSEIVLASKNLALLHICSKGYEPPENSKLKSDLGRWPYLMEKRIKSLDKMRDMSRKRALKSSFELEYLKIYTTYKELGIRAFNVLKNSNYQNICLETENEKSFCHHDYTYHNIIINDENFVHVIDFDYSKREVRAYDIANFMIKVLKKVNWDVSYGDLIIKSYNEISKLSQEEYYLIYAFLLFPQRFWRLSNRYYYNEVNWGQNTFTKKIIDLYNEYEKYMKFIDEFKIQHNIVEE